MSSAIERPRPEAAGRVSQEQTVACRGSGAPHRFLAARNDDSVAHDSVPRPRDAQAFTVRGRRRRAGFLAARCERMLLARRRSGGLTGRLKAAPHRLLASTAFVLFILTSTGAMASAQRTFVASYGAPLNTALNCSITKPCRAFSEAISVTNPDGEVIVLDSAGHTLGNGELTIASTNTGKPQQALGCRLQCYRYEFS